MSDGTPDPDKGGVEILADPGLANFLERTRAALAFTTYQASKLFFVGVNAAGRLSIFERTLSRCMGLSAFGSRIRISTHYQLWRLENFLDPGQIHDGYDAVFVPLEGHTTGAIDIHDIVEGPDGSPLFVATGLNCLATLDDRHSFVALWTPPFIDALVAEDRCHLNGLAYADGAPRYVTCLAASNEMRGWDDRRRDGGIVLDVATGETVTRGLSMPHSPRLHDGRLWLLQSGTGEFGVVNLHSGRFEAILALPGLPRGMVFLEGHAVIGLSRPRAERTFAGLALHDRFKAEGGEPICGLVVVDLATGRLVHQIEIKGPIEELYDVAVLPGYRRPMSLGFANDEIHRFLRPRDARAGGFA